MRFQRTVIAALGLGVLLATACGQGENPDIIGVRPQPTEVAATPAPFDPTSIAAELQAETALASGMPAIEEQFFATGELPLDTNLTLKQIQRLELEQYKGTSHVRDRLLAIATMRSEIAADSSMPSYERYQLLGDLDSLTATLTQYQVKFAAETQVSTSRTDVATVARMYVLTLILPRDRLLVLAYRILLLANIYANEQSGLQQQINGAQAFGKDVTLAQSYVNRLASHIAAMRQAASSAIAILNGLSAGGYPGNKPLLLRARDLLGAGQGDGASAAAEANSARHAMPA